ncbi:hypothetical protein [uncultured Sphingomonas sp.]|uniref:hypothetical protein n=1 Tax=uncultured Sphingomonas sp. TaxID=158754 RepID=UPI0025FE389A|nr:hypothetical protein [uncultured Sphingomonas sp.]
MNGRRAHLALPAAALLLLAGCAHPENYRWSDQAPPQFVGTPRPPTDSAFNVWDTPAVSVYSFPTATPTTPDITLRDLSDRGQAALIQAMTAAGADPTGIRDALLKAPKPKTEATEDAVNVEGAYKRTLVANVTKGWNAVPGERLVWTWIDVQPVNFAFEGYTVIATDNQLLNIEQITNATTASANASLGKTGSETTATTTAGTPVSKVLTDVAGSTAGVGGTLSNTYTTTASINQQYVKLGADIVPGELRIFRESERNLDVAGNTLIALTLKLAPTKWRGVGMETSLRVSKQTLAKPDGSLNDPADVTFELMQNQAPPRCALQAIVILHYQTRRPRDGRSYVEGEQTVTYARASTVPAVVDVVPADEVRKPAWRVYAKASPKIALHASGPFETDLPIDFASYEQARNFVIWLMRMGPKVLGKNEPVIGKTGLRLTSGISDQPLFTGDYFVKRVEDPANLATGCAGMRTRALPVAPALPAPTPEKK